ncbi:lasso RiPP family leader peptide-containing protein [Nocardiopsis quinghaiensis]|nr:lasso RiPP family leader peptide-containing protein [Nocardiopsis quinghaiensis]
MQEQAYEPPVLVDLGDARELTLGSASQDTADLNTARYY